MKLILIYWLLDMIVIVLIRALQFGIPKEDFPKKVVGYSGGLNCPAYIDKLHQVLMTYYNSNKGSVRSVEVL